jgi:Protein of unknown function (DUF2795)
VRGVRRGGLGRWLARDPLISFPATKQEILASLRRTGAPDNLIMMVRAMPEKRYERREDLTAAAASVLKATPSGTRQRRSAGT